uniref:Uncharacterized protein n=1 Tax=Acrobeloides nanus TaxID=290746 RepID=A0A914DLY3_9BILA
QHQNQQQRVGTPNSIGDPRKVLPPRGATPTGQIIREKPPTPPPRGERDRSRSPARSPLVVKKRPQTADLQKSIYQKERDRIANTDYLSDDEDETGEFSHLKTLVG